MGGGKNFLVSAAGLSILGNGIFWWKAKTKRLFSQCRLEILVFSTQLCELLPLYPYLWINSPPFPLSCVNKYPAYTYTVCKGGGYGVLGLRQINTCRKVPLHVNFLDDDILHCLL
jgi:hypothetical protein